MERGVTTTTRARLAGTRPGRALAELRWGWRASRPRLAHLLRIDAIRFIVARVRFAYLRRTHGIQTLDRAGGGVTERTVSHNLTGLWDFSVVRSELLLRPLSVIEAVTPDAKVLSIGPRTEGELLNLVAHGFRAANVRGLDLISYSPWVDLGDMHAMPYPDNTWDVIILAWVLAYSDDWDTAAKEVVRVARHGAVVAIGVEHNPLTDDEIIERYGYKVGGDDRLRSTDQILKLFGNHVDSVYFTHDIPAHRRGDVGGIATVFSLQKESS